MRATQILVRTTFLLLVFVLTVGQDRCPPPDYHRPSPPEDLPGGTAPALNEFQEKAPANPPDPLVCDVPVYQTITLSQPNVNCQAGFNYMPLFNAAKGIQDGVATVTRCPANCSPVHTWIERLTTECLGNTAGIVMEIGLVCPTEEGPRPAGLAITATDPRLAGPPIALPNPQPPAQPSIGDVTGTLPPNFIGCQPPEMVQFRYREPAQCGPARFNYRPYVRRAQRRAAMICDGVVCGPGCADVNPPKLVRTQWGCRNGAEVDIRIDAQCCQ